MYTTFAYRNTVPQSREVDWEGPPVWRRSRRPVRGLGLRGEQDVTGAIRVVTRTSAKSHGSIHIAVGDTNAVALTLATYPQGMGVDFLRVQGFAHSEEFAGLVVWAPFAARRRTRSPGDTSI